MRLEELYLDGFGRFHQQTIGISEPVTVFYGPNEAGKSTLLAFVRTVLFGFPTRGRTEHYPPLAGGRHGGRIRFSDDAGVVYTLERFAGARGGVPSLLTGAGEPLDVATTLPRLTGAGHAGPVQERVRVQSGRTPERRSDEGYRNRRPHLQRRFGRFQTARFRPSTVRPEEKALSPRGQRTENR